MLINAPSSEEDCDGPEELEDSDNDDDGELFSCGVRPRNVDRSRIEDLKKHEWIEAGLANLAEVKTFDVLEQGHTFIVVTGQQWPSDPQKPVHIVANITGLFRVQKLIDVTLTSFVDEQSACELPLKFPFDVSFVVKPNKVAEAFPQVVSR